MIDETPWRRSPLGAVVLALFIGLAAPLGGSGTLALVASPARADEALNKEAVTAVEAWIHAVASGDPARVEALTAPEFQIVRGDGSAHDRATYLTDLPVLENIPDMHDVVATASGDQMVVRYTVRLTKDVNGTMTDADGPRLTVLRRQDDVWLVVAHSNFAAVVQE